MLVEILQALLFTVVCCECLAEGQVMLRVGFVSQQNL